MDKREMFRCFLGGLFMITQGQVFETTWESIAAWSKRPTRLSPSADGDLRPAPPAISERNVSMPRSGVNGALQLTHLSPARKVNTMDVIETLGDLFLLRGVGTGCSAA
jgi:hypothetical protein